MNMAEAKAILMELASGKYHCIEYKLHDHGGGHVSQECGVYIAEVGSFKADHWDGALNSLKDALSGKPPISEALPVSQKKDSLKAV